MIELEFLQEVVLIAIPTVAGILTSYLISDSWQKRKEGLELQKMIIDEFDKSYPNYILEMATIWDTIMLHYHQPFTTPEKAEGPLFNWPSIEEDFKPNDEPRIVFKDTFAKINKFKIEIYRNAEKFESTLKVYYDDDSLLKDYKLLENNIIKISNFLEVMLNSNNFHEIIIDGSQGFLSAYDKSKESVKNFKNRLLNSKLRKPKF